MGKITPPVINCEDWKGTSHMMGNLVPGRVGEVWGEELSGRSPWCHTTAESLCREQLDLSLGLGLKVQGNSPSGITEATEHMCLCLLNTYYMPAII